MAADVMRVAKTYLTKENRNVAIYTRKAASKSADAEVKKVEAKGGEKAAK
jgi:hypothetical protein